MHVISLGAENEQRKHVFKQGILEIPEHNTLGFVPPFAGDMDDSPLASFSLTHVHYVSPSGPQPNATQ